MGKNAVNILWETLCTYFFPPFFLPPSCYRWNPQCVEHCESNWVLHLSSNVIVYFVFFFFTVSSYHSHHIISNVSWIKCGYFLSSVFNMEPCISLCILLSSRVGWMTCTACCLLSPKRERDVYLPCPTCLLKRGYFAPPSNSCSSFYSMLYKNFFFKRK